MIECIRCETIMRRGPFSHAPLSVPSLNQLLSVSKSSQLFSSSLSSLFTSQHRPHISNLTRSNSNCIEPWPFNRPQTHRLSSFLPFSFINHNNGGRWLHSQTNLHSSSPPSSTSNSTSPRFKRRTPPSNISRYLENVALYYLGRYTTTTARFQSMLRRRVSTLERRHQITYGEPEIAPIIQQVARLGD